MSTEKTSLKKENHPSCLSAFAITGTFHGSIVEAESEGEARRIFHQHYNGESITHIRKRNIPAWVY
jgi:hypothetical protein